jgi:hypothetical protein
MRARDWMNPLDMGTALNIDPQDRMMIGAFRDPMAQLTPDQMRNDARLSMARQALRSARGGAADPRTTLAQADLREAENAVIYGDRLGALTKMRDRGYENFGSGGGPAAVGEQPWQWARLQQAIPALAAASQGRAAAPPPMTRPTTPSFIADDRIATARRAGQQQATDRHNRAELDFGNALNMSYNEGGLSSGQHESARRRHALAGMYGRV